MTKADQPDAPVEPDSPDGGGALPLESFSPKEGDDVASEVADAAGEVAADTFVLAMVGAGKFLGAGLLGLMRPFESFGGIKADLDKMESLGTNMVAGIESNPTGKPLIEVFSEEADKFNAGMKEINVANDEKMKAKAEARKQAKARAEAVKAEAKGEARPEGG